MERDAHFQSLLLHIAQSSRKKISPDKTKSTFFSESPVKELPYMCPQQSPCGEMLCLQSGWFTYSSIYSPQLRSFPTKWVENIQSPSTDPHMGRRPTHNEVWPGPPRGSFMTLLLVPLCHAAFSTILSTLTWIDQSPVCQCVCHSNPQQVSPPLLLPPPI